MLVCDSQVQPGGPTVPRGRAELSARHAINPCHASHCRTILCTQENGSRPIRSLPDKRMLRSNASWYWKICEVLNSSSETLFMSLAEGPCLDRHFHVQVTMANTLKPSQTKSCVLRARPRGISLAANSTLKCCLHERLQRDGRTVVA